MKIAFEVAAKGADELGECPLWDEQSGLLWWVDSRAPAVKRLDPASGTVTRYTPAGKVDRTIELPVANLTCCCFGGRDLDVLYLTSARQRMSPGDLASQPLAGSVLALRTGAQGLPESRFAG